jgi:hypothetical protein
MRPVYGIPPQYFLTRAIVSLVSGLIMIGIGVGLKVVTDQCRAQCATGFCACIVYDWWFGLSHKLV